MWAIVQNTITFKDYIKCLRENLIITREQRNIRSRRHNIHTEKEKKIALSAHDDKRCLQPDTTDTLPWGHSRAGVVEERANEDEAVGEGEREPPNAAEELLYNGAGAHSNSRLFKSSSSAAAADPSLASCSS